MSIAFNAFVQHSISIAGPRAPAFGVRGPTMRPHSQTSPEGVPMKRLALCLVAFSLLALSGCVTYKYHDETETRQLSHDQVFKKASSASQFNVADGAGGWGIRLAYVDNYDAYTVTKHASYRVNFRQPTMVVNRWGDSRPMERRRSSTSPRSRSGVPKPFPRRTRRPKLRPSPRARR